MENEGSGWDVFYRIFRSRKEEPEDKETLQDEAAAIKEMNIGSVIEGWGGGKLTKVADGLWRYDQKAIKGGAQHFGEHVHLVELARYMWPLRDYFRENFGAKWAKGYKWAGPQGVRYYPITGIDADLVETGIVSCNEVGFKGMRLTETECERLGIDFSDGG